MGFKKYWYSLRFRYTLSAVVLMLVVIFSSYVAYKAVHLAQQETSNKLARNHQASEITRQIRVAILSAYTFINAYLLEPSHSEYQQQAIQSIDNSISSAGMLTAYASLNPKLHTDNTNKLINLLKDLKYRSQILFEVRGDASRQYPSLEIGATVMRHNRNAYNNAVALALYEIQAEGLDKIDTEIYADFIQARFLWTQVLSNFRLYMANRVGSYNEQSLPRQELAIKTMYQELRKQHKKLDAHQTNNKLGFQTVEALSEMKRTAKNWFSGFEIVLEINHSDGWRMDSKIMKEDIVPVINKMSVVITDLETAINVSIIKDVEDLGRTSTKQVNIFVWAGIVMLMFLLLNYWSTSRLVFRPIATVVRALRSKAAGKSAELLPVVRSYETAALFDAFREMSNRVQIRQEALEYQALHDSLTTLPNRILLQERIAYQIENSRRNNSNVTLLIIDLDRFKEINDTLGHHVGDQLLIKIGQRLQSLVRTNDTVARLGGDEFAIVLPDSDCIQAKTLCKKLSDSISQAYDVDELQLYVSMSIGIACFPDHGDDVHTLIQHADVAMYVAKQNKLGCDVYDPGKDDNSLYRLNLNSDLRVALDEDQLELYYQPVIDLKLETVAGVECLLRWKHPVHGWLSPEYIVELSEHTGLINPLTYWVLNKALESGEELQRLGHSLRVAINISAHNLKEPDFVLNVQKIIAARTMSVDYLSFEITENAMMSNPVIATKMLKEFDDMGIHLAIDDFGTGYSSLAYLKQLPVNEMKIDKSFVMSMANNGSDETIVRSTIELAHNLGMKVIAEGVETLEAYNKLSDYGADKAQGYYMSRPVSLKALQKWLPQWRSPQ
ncbi:MAG: EAL domain-containing protein [Gammaproteobacteria bacterium]|nr:EAL domain-containing protein [Gammaproteobacteria bacterium]